MKIIKKKLTRLKKSLRYNSRLNFDSIKIIFINNIYYIIKIKSNDVKSDINLYYIYYTNNIDSLIFLLNYTDCLSKCRSDIQNKTIKSFNESNENFQLPSGVESISSDVVIIDYYNNLESLTKLEITKIKKIFEPITSFLIGNQFMVKSKKIKEILGNEANEIFLEVSVHGSVIIRIIKLKDDYYNIIVDNRFLPLIYYK